MRLSRGEKDSCHTEVENCPRDITDGDEEWPGHHGRVNPYSPARRGNNAAQESSPAHSHRDRRPDRNSKRPLCPTCRREACYERGRRTTNQANKETNSHLCAKDRELPLPLDLSCREAPNQNRRALNPNVAGEADNDRDEAQEVGVSAEAVTKRSVKDPSGKQSAQNGHALQGQSGPYAPEN